MGRNSPEGKRRIFPLVRSPPKEKPSEMFPLSAAPSENSYLFCFSEACVIDLGQRLREEKRKSYPLPSTLLSNAAPPHSPLGRKCNGKRP